MTGISKRSAISSRRTAYGSLPARHAEIADGSRWSSLLVADDANAFALKAAETTDDSGVVAELAVAGKRMNS